MKLSTLAVLGLVLMWLCFQIWDSTPPVVLDQLLVATFSAWFANEALDKHKETKNKDRDEKDQRRGDDGTAEE